MFWTAGNLTILGGVFDGNEADGRGGVFLVKEGIVVVENGTFGGGNEAEDGAVGFASDGSKLYVNGGTFSGNSAGNGGGVFYIDENTMFAVSFGGRTGEWDERTGEVVDAETFGLQYSQRSLGRQKKAQQQTLEVFCFASACAKPFVMVVMGNSTNKLLIILRTRESNVLS